MLSALFICHASDSNPVLYVAVIFCFGRHISLDPNSSTQRCTSAFSMALGINVK